MDGCEKRLLRSQHETGSSITLFWLRDTKSEYSFIKITLLVGRPSFLLETLAQRPPQPTYRAVYV